MKHCKGRILFVFILLIEALSVSGQQIFPRLVVRGDDMGSSHSANRASIETFLNGIETSIEVMVVAPWYPEAVKMLKEHPSADVGLHLVLTSEWEAVKWRPLSDSPSLTDSNGYFYPMITPNKNYPGLALTENKWDIKEIEREFRAQIELGLKTLPQISHISGHMMSTGFDPAVATVVQRLSEEYDLPVMDRRVAAYSGVGYNGPKGTLAEKKASFIKMLDQLQPGKNYLFVDHPALDNAEMETVGHVGYEDVATDRQGVTDLWTSPEVKQAIASRNIELVTFTDIVKPLPRSTPEAEKVNPKGIDNYLSAVEKAGQDLHSLMILRHGKVVAERWLGDHSARKPHILNSVSKTYTSTAVGFAVSEGLLKVSDKVISFFPDKLPAEVSPYLRELEIRHLLTMTVGHDTDPTRVIRSATDKDWVESFLAYPVEHKPGTEYVYNSLATYMLSAIVQKVTGQKVIDYLYPRLFRPLGIAGINWDESPQGINTGGWGLYVKTEDMAKLGQFYLQKGVWNGKRLLPESWFDEATSAQVPSLPAGVKRENLKVKPKDSDWLQGYGYQIWRCRHNAYRADGAAGQYIIVLPEKDAVIVTTAQINDMQAEINLIWKHLLPALR
jgi:CubicO group peptidase (beta-lactamase class C family)/predicted glycoside hydrolase/deacetylase ChbG (UPF0249 family)